MFSMQVAGQFGEAYWDSLDAIFHLSRLIVHSARAFMTMLFPLAIAGNLLMPSYSNLFLKYKVPATSEGFVASFKKLQYNFPKMRGGDQRLFGTFPKIYPFWSC